MTSTATEDPLGDDHPAVVRVDDDLDSLNASELREALGRLVGRRAVVVDLQGTSFVDSAGLGALVGGARRIREGGGVVALCCTRPNVLRLLAMTGFDRLVTVTGSVDEARAALAEARLNA